MYHVSDKGLGNRTDSEMGPLASLGNNWNDMDIFIPRCCTRAPNGSGPMASH